MSEMRRRHKVAWICATFAITFCVVPAFAYKVVPDGEPDDPKPVKPLNIGNIHGEVGGLRPWVSETSGTQQLSQGVYGGRWGADASHRSQEQMVPQQSESQNDTLVHKFKVESGSGSQPKYLSAEVFSEQKRSGRSNQMNMQSPGWWWRCSVVSNHDRAVIRYRNGAGDWHYPGLDSDSDPTDDTGRSVNGEHEAPDVVQPLTTPSNTYPVPANVQHHDPNVTMHPPLVSHPAPTNYPEQENGSRNGSYAAVTSETIPSTATDIQVSMNLDTNANASVDNAIVTDWEVGLKIDMRSETHINKPSYP